MRSKSKRKTSIFEGETVPVFEEVNRREDRTQNINEWKRRNLPAATSDIHESLVSFHGLELLQDDVLFSLNLSE